MNSRYPMVPTGSRMSGYKFIAGTSTYSAGGKLVLELRDDYEAVVISQLDSEH